MGTAPPNTPAVASPFAETDAISRLRTELAALLGPEVLTRAHEENLWLDAAALAAMVGAFIFNFFAISLFDPSFPILIGISLVQGWLLLAMPLLCHDLFEHRRAWEGVARDWLSAILFLPTTTPATVHRVGHYRHHAKLGTVDDTEASLAGVNTTIRRILFSTAIGYLLARGGHWGSAGSAGYEALLGATKHDQMLKRREVLMLAGWLALMMLFSVSGSGETILFGYWLPLIFVAPTLVTIRIIIEHANLDPTNPWWIATYYRCGPITKFLFVADCGDCHLIHHVFPRVAWYNVPRLARAAHPYLLEKGLVPTGNLASLIWEWFVSNREHRTLWSPSTIGGSREEAQRHVR